MVTSDYKNDIKYDVYKNHPNYHLTINSEYLSPAENYHILLSSTTLSPTHTPLTSVNLSNDPEVADIQKLLLTLYDLH